MARLAIFRSMHNVRPGNKHRPARAIALDAAAVAYLRLCDVEVGSAWSTERLTDTRRRLEEEARWLRVHALDTERKSTATGPAAAGPVDDAVRARVAARLASDARHVALERFIELAREAEGALMTLVYDEEPASE